jgi:pyruvate dehydrogenase phosphatase
LTANDKFLVLASDGLWEWLDPDVVVRLISDHAVGAQTLSLYQPPAEHTLNDVSQSFFFINSIPTRFRFWAIL